MRLIAADDWSELDSAFGAMIPFGTGGRRGPTGPGPNRINLRTIGESAQGLAQHVLAQGRQFAARGVVVAFDTRVTSHDFALETARVLAGNGIKTYLFEQARATPELSFAVRYYKAAAGVVISASHNPPRDNGFKAYWEDGGQIVPPHDEAIIQQVKQASTLQRLELDQARTSGLLVTAGGDVDRAYQAAVLGQSLLPDRALRIVFSPLHGTGLYSVLPVLQQAGFPDIKLVESQAAPDGSFPNVEKHFPNPELPGALRELIAQVSAAQADIGLATDPDADRLAVVVRAASGEVRALNGNQTAALLCHHILSTRLVSDMLPHNGLVVETVVTTPLVRRIAAAHGIECVYNLLVGFKYIAEIIRQTEGSKVFLFGCEESLGYLAGTYARDKDAAVAALLICELAASLKNQGETLLNQLDDLYLRHGLHHETQRNLYVAGLDGMTRIDQIMRAFRERPPKQLGGKQVVRVVDRATGRIFDGQTGAHIGTEEGTQGNVIILFLDDSTQVTIRPSGTEPKAKFYVAVRRDPPAGLVSGPELDKIVKMEADNAERLADLVLEDAQRI